MSDDLMNGFLREYFRTSPKKGRGKGRGMAKRSLDLIEVMAEIAEECQPITGRGIGYKLFSRGLIPSMSRGDMATVYRLLRIAREEGTIEWDWIVDETREIEVCTTWKDPKAYVASARRWYRRDFWQAQDANVLVASEKGTVRGVLEPTLDQYGVGFLAVHGFNSATTVNNLCETDDSKELIVLYVGDYDPSGMCMSESDLPKRIEAYGGDHIRLERIALLPQHTSGLLSFPAADKRKDPRYRWFVENYGEQCWELDAMDPNALRAVVENAIQFEIDDEAWERSEKLQQAEQDSLQTFFDAWGGAS